MMSTWLPVTEEIKKEAQKILDQNWTEKDEYLKDNLVGSVSSESSNVCGFSREEIPVKDV